MKVLTAKGEDSYHVKKRIMTRQSFTNKGLIDRYPVTQQMDSYRGYNRLNLKTDGPSATMPGHFPENSPTTLTKSEQEEVREQLRRLLDNPFFSHSKRFPTFLRFVVEQTLAGKVDSIKERTLGIEIFGRDADYDTASDPIVRVTAAEIRKRVAQYYQDPAHVDELHIALPSGSYIPHFHWPNGADDPVLKELAQAAADDIPVSAEHPDANPVLPHRYSFALLAVACVATATSVGGFSSSLAGNTSFCVRLLLGAYYHHARPDIDLRGRSTRVLEHRSSRRFTAISSDDFER